MRICLMIAVLLTCGGAHAGGDEDDVQRSEEDGERMARIDALLDAYETLRAALAEDRYDEVGPCAERVVTHAQLAHAGAPVSQQRVLADVSEAARGMRSGGSPDEQRIRFGEVSRGVVALLVLDPALVEGRHIFECGMSQGYSKWIQEKKKLDNPYMGQRMPRCGSASDWSP